jgi:hypothetical protein
MLKVEGPRRVRIYTPTTQLNKLSHALSCKLTNLHRLRVELSGTLSIYTE